MYIITILTKVRERKYRRLEHSIMVQADIRSRCVIIAIITITIILIASGLMMTKVA